MKGLWKYISPFAPDQSGAVAVLYALQGLIVICDAGGCAGNVCGFDEPRWFQQKSAIFSAGLRDMDAILGRDDKLVDKLVLASRQIQSDFAAIIGTPVPSVIGTDYQALTRLAEKRLQLPVVTIDSTGMAHYDSGAEKAYVALFKKFAVDRNVPESGTVGILGATPLDVKESTLAILVREIKKAIAKNVVVYGKDNGIAAFREAGCSSRNYVVAPSGLAAARYLQDRFGTPYEQAYPFTETEVLSMLPVSSQQRILVIHQQVAANAIRKVLRHKGFRDITVGTWFMLQKEWQEPQDIEFREEDTFIDYVSGQHFDVIIGDAYLQRALPGFHGLFIDIPHFAVSGRT